MSGIIQTDDGDWYPTDPVSAVKDYALRKRRCKQHRCCGHALQQRVPHVRLRRRPNDSFSISGQPIMEVIVETERGEIVYEALKITMEQDPDEGIARR